MLCTENGRDYDIFISLIFSCFQGETGDEKKTKKDNSQLLPDMAWLWEYLKTFTWSIWYEIAADLGVLSLSIETVGYCQSVAAKNWNLMRQALTHIPSGYLSLKCHLHTRWKTSFLVADLYWNLIDLLSFAFSLLLSNCVVLFILNCTYRRRRGAERLSCPSSKGTFLKHHGNCFWRAVCRKLCGQQSIFV